MSGKVESVQSKLNNDAVSAIRASTGEATQILEEYSNVRHTLEQSKTQLDRDGQPFTKTDIIAILCALDRQYISQKTELTKFTIPVLTTIVRAIVFSPERQFPEPHAEPHVAVTPTVAALPPVKPPKPAKKPTALALTLTRTPQPYELININ